MGWAFRWGCERRSECQFRLGGVRLDSRRPLLSATAERECVAGHGHGVNVLIFDDTDPAWKTLNALTTRRAPLYANLHYIVFACGE